MTTWRGWLDHLVPCQLGHDPTIFFTRPISLALLVLAAGIVVLITSSGFSRRMVTDADEAIIAADSGTPGH